MLVVGHRGAASRAPENTLVSFRAAIEAGADAIETDVRFTADGHLVLMHDDDVSRTTDGVGLLSTMLFPQVRELNAAAHFAEWPSRERVPTLDELLALDRGLAGLVLELKGFFRDGEYRSASDVAMAVLDRIDGLANVVISSFDPSAIAVVRARAPGVSTAFTTHPAFEASVNLAAVIDAGHADCHLPDSRVDATIVARAHEVGKRVFVYTVNDPLRALALRAMGVDGIFTDDPAAMMRGLGR